MIKRLVLLLMILLLTFSGALFAGELVVRNFVDDFGDPTDNPYITTSSRKNGTFSNSATTNSSLSWDILITDSSVSFMLYEYKDLQVTGSSISPDKYAIKVKGSDGEVHKLYGENWSDRIVLNRGKDFREILEKEGIVKIVISNISGYTYSEYNLGSLNANGYKALYSKTFGIPVHVDASSTIWAEGARLLGEHPEMLRNSVKLEMTIRDKYGSLIFDKTVPDGNLLETDFVAKSTNRYTVELRYFLNEELIGFHSETLIPILGDNNYNYTITLDDLSENAYQLAKEAYQSVDAERVAREQEKVEQERKLLEKEQRRIEEEERQKRKEAATALLEGRNDMPSVNTVEEKKKLEFSLGMNIGYYGSVFNSSFLRTGVDIQLTWPVDMFVLGLRVDCSAYTYGLGRNYPGFDISASFVLGMDIADFGTGKVFLETAYGLGYLNSMEGYSGDPFDTVTFRVLMGLGVRFGGFKVTTDILFDTGIYSYYDSYFEFSTTGIELAFTPMISIGYSF